MVREKTFREIMERHKRIDSWIVTILLCVLLFRGLWRQDLIISLAAFILLFVLPFLFPKPKRKLKFIDEVIEWEIAWCKLSPYSKLIDWFIETVGFVLIVYGTWQHNWLFLSLGFPVLIIGLIDFLVRFGYRQAFVPRIQNRN